ncbi:MAG: DUF3095 domain-containing protein [Alphaproteobacteria bacterium]|nr:DUF3095 domain-containing protein [Rhodospirillaceae bacterium]MBT6205657.1 DUF3095 domain-containing protein [Rhodospirillaceae bacterium]MBT6509017.1 DUF3095 domain-containing protein [Rhodospirillaceae bacterium]MBT7648431.1 DUF3095 domain-containing protein [Rhodospirillaceae bacterium]MDG2483056.1 DUF3095 domain-containing protein [Alphaproteobacteria bacterium]
MAASDDGFYEALPSFDSFDDVTRFEAYTPVPDDWVVLLSDVVGSTKAIRAGRYKDVNMVGAATITSVLNTCGTTEIPFVFGGDGATMVLPASLLPAAKEALLDLQSASVALYGLELRVGAVPVCVIRHDGHDVAIRKYRLSPGNHLAMLAGGGAERAEDLIKSGKPGDGWLFEASAERGPPDLEGLSCRWQPLTARDGCMLTLMIQGMGSDAPAQGAVLGSVLANIARILGHSLDSSAPANQVSMRFKWPPAGLMREARALARGGALWKKVLWVLGTGLVQAWCETFDRKAGDYDAPKYRGELRANTDFRKYDGVLRTVLDVTPDQAEIIEAYLEREYQRGHLIYGVHTAGTALMTCLLFNLEQGEHVHFIDGSGGGFAMAAVGFKERLAARATR